MPLLSRIGPEKPFSAKHTKRNRSRSPSKEQSTTSSNYQSRDQEIPRLKADIEQLKQIYRTGNTNMDHNHQNLEIKIKLYEKSKTVQKTDQQPLKQEAKQKKYKY